MDVLSHGNPAELQSPGLGSGNILSQLATSLFQAQKHNNVWVTLITYVLQSLKMFVWTALAR